MFIIRGIWTAILLMFFTLLHLLLVLLTLVVKFLCAIPGMWLLFMKFFAYIAVILAFIEFDSLWAYLNGGFEHVLLFALGIGGYFAFMYLPLFLSVFVYVALCTITDSCANKRNDLFLVALNK